jgi:hypothetical protein
MDDTMETPCGPLAKFEQSAKGALFMTGMTKLDTNSLDFPREILTTLPLDHQNALSSDRHVFGRCNEKHTITRLMIEKEYQGTRIMMITFSDGLASALSPPWRSPIVSLDLEVFMETEATLLLSRISI